MKPVKEYCLQTFPDYRAVFWKGGENYVDELTDEELDVDSFYHFRESLWEHPFLMQTGDNSLVAENVKSSLPRFVSPNAMGVKAMRHSLGLYGGPSNPFDCVQGGSHDRNVMTWKERLPAITFDPKIHTHSPPNKFNPNLRDPKALTEDLELFNRMRACSFVKLKSDVDKTFLRKTAKRASF
jgi:hypothetical protein